MPSAIEIIGLVFGILSLSGLCNAGKKTVARRQPPGRLREVQDALASTRALIDDLERGGYLSGAERREGAEDADSYRRRLTELDNDAIDLRLAVQKWSSMPGIFSNHLQKDIETMCTHLYNLPPPPARSLPPRRSPMVDAPQDLHIVSAASTATTEFTSSTPSESSVTSISSSPHSPRPPDPERIALVEINSDRASPQVTNDTPQAHASGVETTLTDGTMATVRNVAAHRDDSDSADSADTSSGASASADSSDQTPQGENGPGEKEQQQRTSQRSSRTKNPRAEAERRVTYLTSNYFSGGLGNPYYFESAPF
ncbi:uncharacterized protein TRAVEDRAFT_16025 [Trametes versicolor FP-101664 SS1]|uniref:uncharacterized protein n=1 Tax=Trametes versicolor (strain FP-101664) TaxID=717944 RepID=UPI0004623911|nr:uncharacterized protein TRAVEDRAFT_16025 [Trametes versicolor FP-101664 SS1]EIW63708.1 hypothetical protein TRAVEDRAFT_16025 [Trametes versicolor FP-101664 SS1]